MSIHSPLPDPSWPPVLDAVDPRPELRRAAEHAAEAVALVARTGDVAWAGAAADGYRDLVVEAVHELYRADRAADQAVGAAARYLRTVDTANAEASLR
ncbi:hypothetical protein [Oerskovia turbata]